MNSTGDTSTVSIALIGRVDLPVLDRGENPNVTNTVPVHNSPWCAFAVIVPSPHVRHVYGYSYYAECHQQVSSDISLFTLPLCDATRLESRRRRSGERSKVTTIRSGRFLGSIQSSQRVSSRLVRATRALPNQQTCEEFAFFFFPSVPTPRSSPSMP